MSRIEGVWVEEVQFTVHVNVQQCFFVCAYTFSKRVGVFCCGPKGISRTLHRLCNSASTTGTTFEFNKESFSWLDVFGSGFIHYRTNFLYVNCISEYFWQFFLFLKYSPCLWIQQQIWHQWLSRTIYRLYKHPCTVVWAGQWADTQHEYRAPYRPTWSLTEKLQKLQHQPWWTSERQCSIQGNLKRTAPRTIPPPMVLCFSEVWFDLFPSWL